MKKYFIIHPFLFGLFHVLFLFSHNIEIVSKSDFLYPSVLVLGITLILIIILMLILKDIKKVAIIVSVSIILFFTYGRFYDLILDQYIGIFEIGRHRYLLFIWILLFSSSAYYTIRTHRNLQHLTSLLNIIALTLVLISLFNIGIYQFNLKNIKTNNSERLKCLENHSADFKNKAELPDIYYIILDGYASTSTLKKVYNYDNQNFTDYLTSKGFYITPKSHSNYPMTFLSLASSLNLQYINYLSDEIEVGSREQTVPYQMISDNEVIKFLKFNGYKIINSSSGWEPTEQNIFADLNIQSKNLKEFMRVLIQTTALRPIEKPFMLDLRKDRMYTYSKLANIHNVSSPKFIFSHIVAPHPPYLFGKNGEPVLGVKLTLSGDLWRKKDAYINQLIFTNKQIEKIISEILANSKVPPIIILQADHGTGSTFPEDIFWWGVGLGGKPTSGMLEERFSILNAYYLPAGGSNLLYDSITPVNTFRLIFDYYFDTKCGFINDKNYYSLYDLPYEFVNVTDSLSMDD